MTKFLLDSGDPQEYKEIATLAKEQGSELWGGTTNPTLIARKIAASGKKLSRQEAFTLQKELVLEIVETVPGAVSGEVYADHQTTADEMIEQGRDIASWHPRVVVKLPTTLEGLKARTVLRSEHIGINNTLMFSQQQIFAVTLHEKLMLALYGPAKTGFPAFLSPFIGRLDDKGENGLSMLHHSIELVRKYFTPDTVWMLEASVRNAEQTKGGIDYGTELETIRTTVLREWLQLTPQQQEAIDVPAYTKNLTDIPSWTPTEELLNITTIEDLMHAISSGKLDITHPLTTAGIDRFVADWNTILA